ncbi:MAG TPA: hypothetical protein VIU64_18985 [Polyangia bacterium]
MTLGRLERLVISSMILALCAIACGDRGGLGTPGGGTPMGSGGSAGTFSGAAGRGAPGGRLGGLAGGGPGGSASGGLGGAAGRGAQIITKNLSTTSKVDLLFMIDDSAGMAPLQAKMQAQIPAFVDALTDPATAQLPDLHVAVVSSSFGGGAWGNVNQCFSRLANPNTLGDDGGRFLQGAVGPNPSPCTMLHTGTKFLANRDGFTLGPNYDGALSDALKCIAILGDKGCGFESPFESVYYGLYKGLQPDDPDNGGFVRADAALAIVMLTNEDDCSVAGDSLLLAPSVNSVSDPTGLGALQSYRCNEFGHLCDGVPPPHDHVPPTGVTLRNCVSAENDGKTDDLLVDPNGQRDPSRGHLWPTVAELSNYVRMYKSDPDDIFVAAIAGPVIDAKGNSLYRVIPQVNSAAMNEIDPVVDHSCVQATAAGAEPEYADPAVRIKQWVDSFGANGAFYPICANDFKAAMVGIATKIHAKLGAFCIATDVELSQADPAQHDCQLTRKTIDASGKQTTQALPECAAGASNAPCFTLVPNAIECGDPASKTLVKICENAACAGPPLSSDVVFTATCTAPR